MTTETPTAAALAEAIAAHLPGWTLKRPAPGTVALEAWAHVTGPDGASLTVQLYGNPRRLSVRGDWPTLPGRDCRDFQPRDVSPNSISLSPERPPAKLAAEIARRLLAWYLPELARMQKLRADTLATEAKACDLAAQLAEIVGEVVRGDERKGWSVGYWKGGDEPSFKLTVTPYGTVSAEVSVADVTDARILAVYLAALTKPHKVVAEREAAADAATLAEAQALDAAYADAGRRDDFDARATAIGFAALGINPEDEPDPGAEAEELRRAALDSRGRP